MIKHQSRTGQSTLEVMVALSILVVCSVALITVVFGNQFMAQYAGQQHDALRVSQEYIEQAKAFAQNNFDALGSSTTSNSGYTNELMVEQIDFLTKKLTSRTTWYVSPGRTSNVELVSIITNWRSLLPDDGTGPGEDPTGEWQCPITAGTVDLGPGNQGTDIVIKDTTVFISGVASASAKPDIYTIDVSDIYSPSEISNINTGKGINSLAINGNYLYAAQNDTANQLQIIDVSNPGAMLLVSSTTLVSSNKPGLSIFEYKHYVYIGTEFGTGNELQIFDVSNPQTPVPIAGLNLNMNINDIYIFDDRAYLATSGFNQELAVVDVSNPNAPTQIDSFDCASQCSGSTQGMSVFAPNTNDIFLGTNSQLVKLSASTTPIQVQGQYNANGAVYDTYARGYLSFLANSNSNKELQIAHIATTSPYLYSSLNFPQMATGVTYRDNVVECTKDLPLSSS
ncbi:MAG: hypothetical protein UX61_C0030G0006 [Parcubacteria group bacterium GW2011_GWA2_46_7]|nr:MAG: hypothetical protein UX61_C0030G0006 [Parcubacteria group bacterium GW2011_GWA2_46_7]